MLRRGPPATLVLRLNRTLISFLFVMSLDRDKKIARLFFGQCSYSPLRLKNTFASKGMIATSNIIISFNPILHLPSLYQLPVDWGVFHAKTDKSERLDRLVGQSDRAAFVFKRHSQLPVKLMDTLTIKEECESVTPLLPLLDKLTIQ